MYVFTLLSEPVFGVVEDWPCALVLACILPNSLDLHAVIRGQPVVYSSRSLRTTYVREVSLQCAFVLAHETLCQVEFICDGGVRDCLLQLLCVDQRWVEYW